MTTRVFPLGNQQVGIVKHVAVLDGGGQPVRDELHEVQTTEQVIWKDGCSFEVQTLSAHRAEEQTSTTTVTYQMVWVALPVDDDTRVITSDDVLRYGSSDFPVRGDSFVEVDMRGVEQYVFVVAQRQEG